MTLSVFLSNKGQMYFPNPTTIYGSEFFYLKPPPELATIIHKTNYQLYHYYSQNFRLSQTEWKAVDQETSRCEEKHIYSEKTKSVAECIVGYLEQEIGCSMGLHGSQSGTKRFAILIKITVHM